MTAWKQCLEFGAWMPEFAARNLLQGQDSWVFTAWEFTARPRFMHGVVLERAYARTRKTSTATAETCVICDICTREKGKEQDVTWETKE